MPYFTSNDGIRLFYDDIGQGRPLVLIHGWTFSGRFFHRNVSALAENAGIITVDLRGHGRSDKPNHGYRFEQSSHMLFHDEPEKFNATIADFLRQSPKQVGATTGD